jgi:hypothetical protein
MSVLTLDPDPASRFSPALALRRWLTALWARERRLALFGVLLLAVMLPMAVAWALDDRLFRGANVWLKPMKFTLSISVLALTTAWFIGHLPAARRPGRAVNLIVWMLIGTGSFELAYITVQAGLGHGSHYNVADTWHATMFQLMGVGAILLTATQPMLAWQLYRHPDPALPAAYRQAVLIGLVLTFVFGTGAGSLLAQAQPPEGGITLPFTGWALGGGDLRPAHFMGIHAEQVLPAIAFATVALGLRRGTAIVWASTLAYALMFALLVAWGMSGR